MMHTKLSASVASVFTVLPETYHLSGLTTLSNSLSANCVEVESLSSDLQASKAKRKVIFKRAESYVKEYLAQEKEEIRLKRAARAAGDFYVPAQAKVYFVIRIRG